MMTKLSSKGQVILPKLIRDQHNWSAGVEFTVIDTDEGILLKPFKLRKARYSLDEVAGCLAYKGKAKTLKMMDDGIKKGLKKQ